MCAGRLFTFAPRPLQAMLVALLFFFALLSVAPARAERDMLTIGIGQFPSSLNPGIESMMAKAYVLGLARRPFTVYNVEWQLVCMLCAELPTLDNGLARTETTPDGKPGMAVTFSIQPQARWGDGTPVTTRDVTFTWEVGRHAKSGVMPKEFYRSLYRVDTLDDRKFTLHFDKRHFDYNSIDSLELLPAHIEQEAFVDPEAYRFRTRYATQPTEKGLYNGPYVISEISAGSHVVLTRNPHWWGKPPAFSRIVVRSIENTAALEANLLSGSIDMIAGELGLNVDQAVAFEARHGDRFRVLYKPGLVYEHIDLNLDNPILADRRVRQALLYSLDRQAIVGQVFADRQSVANTNVSPLDSMYSEDVHRYRYDPDAAIRLFEEAGWGKLVNGVRVDAAARPLQLEIMTTAGDRTREMVQQVLQSQWKRAGIDARIRNQPARVFFGDTVSRRRFPAMAMFAWISGPESVPRSTLHSREIPMPDNGWAGQNYGGYRNTEVDALVEAIEVELDAGKRRALWHRLQAIYADELPALPLFFRASPFVLPPWLKGVVPTGHQYPTTLWVENWLVGGSR